MKYFNTLAIVVSLLGLLGCASDLTADNTIFAADAGWSGDSSQIAQKIDGVDTTNHDSGRFRRYQEDIAGQAEAAQQDSYDADVAPDVAQEVSIPQCATNCDDNNPCTTDTCYLGECQYVPVPNNCGPNNTSPCDDGNACSSLDCCQDGECKGVMDACDDYNPCTTDSCDKSSGECIHMPVQDGTTCDDINGCTKMDKCQAGKCAGQMPMYSFEPKSENDAFTCISCVDDSECQFKNDTFCPSSYGPPSYGPNFAYHPTGKCIANSCEFKMVWCSDGDLSTYNYCIGGVGSTYPNMKAGVCASTKISAGTNVKNQECWCTGDTEMKCAEYTITAGVISDEKDTVFNCPNGCGPECKGFKDQLGYGGYFK